MGVCNLLERPACEEAPTRRSYAELRGSVDGIVWTPWCFHCWLPCMEVPPNPTWQTWQTGEERYVQARVVEGDEVTHTSPVIMWAAQWWGVA
jgi:hypothetical protein